MYAACWTGCHSTNHAGDDEASGRADAHAKQNCACTCTIQGHIQEKSEAAEASSGRAAEHKILVAVRSPRHEHSETAWAWIVYGCTSTVHPTSRLLTSARHVHSTLYTIQQQALPFRKQHCITSPHRRHAPLSSLGRVCPCRTGLLESRDVHAQLVRRGQHLSALSHAHCPSRGLTGYRTTMRHPTLRSSSTPSPISSSSISHSKASGAASAIVTPRSGSPPSSSSSVSALAASSSMQPSSTRCSCSMSCQ